MLKIALAQMEVSAGHPDDNASKMLSIINEAKLDGAKIIIFPKNAISGCMLGEMELQSAFKRECQEYIQDIMKASGNIKIILDDVVDDSLGFDVVSASTPFAIGDQKIRDERLRNQAKASGRPLIYVNCVGVQNKGKTIYTFDGASTVYNSEGDIVYRAIPYEENLHIIQFDEINSMKPTVEINRPKIAQIYDALCYGVEKFLNQINMKKIVIGISGGIDSAVDAALYTKILGAENVLLVNMPSVFNSATTRGLSEQLAKNLGCNYMVVPIQESVAHTVKQLESIPMTYLTDGSTHNIELSSFVRENIQARDRSSRILAALAAVFGGGFTCNANKAETTIGYATMYGDCAGVVSALADLWKYQVYDLARYLNDTVYGREVIPQGIIDIVPSAELSTAQNVDEGKGDPLKYLYHDYLFRSFVESAKTPEEILQWYADGKLEENIGCDKGLVKKYFANAEEFINDLERWWNQFTGIAVAKRIQAPPIIAVTDRAFGSDFPESQGCTYYTHAYKILKAELLLAKSK